MSNKGAVMNYLCINPSCSYSEEKIVVKSAISSAVSSGQITFKGIKSCPRCKGPVELLFFVSGTVEIEADVITESK